MSTKATTQDYASKCLNVLLWIKFKHNYSFANMHQSHPFLHSFCIQEGAWSLYTFFQNHNYHGRTGNFTYKVLILARQQKALLKYDSFIVQPHKCHVTPELPPSQVAMYLTQTTQPFFLAIARHITSQLATQLIVLYSRITSLTIAIYFAQTTQPFFSLQLQLVTQLVSQLAIQYHQNYLPLELLYILLNLPRHSFLYTVHPYTFHHALLL